jgi:hypothetical protein
MSKKLKIYQHLQVCDKSLDESVDNNWKYAVENLNKAYSLPMVPIKGKNIQTLKNSNIFTLLFGLK